MKAFIFAMGLAALPVTAFAQQAPVAPPYHPAIDNPQVRQAFARTEALQAAAFAHERFGQQYDEFRREQMMKPWLDAHNPRRVRRAEAAATLINDGDCAAAISLAERDGDDRLVLRIQQVCAAISVSEPVEGAARH